MSEMMRNENKTEEKKAPPHRHEWVAVDQDWEPPVLTTYYRCKICGAEKHEAEAVGVDEPQEEEPEPEEG
jgi:hypothetical protein